MVATKLTEEIASLLNKHSAEEDSDTPDFILAEYLSSCLDAFDLATNRRDVWYNKEMAGERDF